MNDKISIDWLYRIRYYMSMDMQKEAVKVLNDLIEVLEYENSL